jgi:hypothetical protein
MNTLRKVFLTISVAAFVLSFTGPGSEFAWGVLKPISALAFIAFFITNLLAKEFAKFDEEQRAKLVTSDRTASGRGAAFRSSTAGRPNRPMAPAGAS